MALYRKGYLSMLGVKLYIPYQTFNDIDYLLCGYFYDKNFQHILKNPYITGHRGAEDDELYSDKWQAEKKAKDSQV